MTTTQDEGVVPTTQPNDAAVQPGDMVIQTDASGTPSMVPAESVQENVEPAQEPSTEPAPKEPAAPEAQTESKDTDEEIIEWAKSKNITIDPSNENEIKLARVNLENDRRFHAERATKVTPPALLPASEDETYNTLIERQNANDVKGYVRDWFDANPDMREHREELSRIAGEHPYIPDMNVIKSIYLADPSREATLRNEGGKRALQNLAQKQSNIPPASAATNSGDFASAKITPQNVDQMVAGMDVAEYEKRLPEINAALAG